MVVLQKLHRSANNPFKNLLVEAFKEKAAIIAEYFGFEDNNVFNSEAGCFHVLHISEMLTKAESRGNNWDGFDCGKPTLRNLTAPARGMLNVRECS
ncbi:hypothetical protein D3C77_577570 [compost metagenome]